MRRYTSDARARGGSSSGRRKTNAAAGPTRSRPPQGTLPEASEILPLHIAGFPRSEARRSLLVFVVAALCFLCASALPKGSVGQEPPPGNEVQPAEIPLETAVEALTIPPEGYVIGAEDVLNIKVYGEPDLSAVVKVGSDGSITMPLIGKVQAAGSTPYQLKRTIEERLRDGYLTNPDVQVFLQQFRERVVHVFGQVGTPGPFRLTHQDTLMEVISRAGGFTPVAKRSKVKIIRKHNGRSTTIYVDTTKITDKGNLQEDVPLQPGDVIIVPERFF